VGETEPFIKYNMGQRVTAESCKCQAFFTSLLSGSSFSINPSFDLVYRKVRLIKDSVTVLWEYFLRQETEQ
jgi:hypothetical protein